MSSKLLPDASRADALGDAAAVAVDAKSSKGRVAVFGAGVAGLSAAHELADAGYAVTVYEFASTPGGHAKSARMPDNRMPTEYSWRGFGPWYNNALEMMRRIPSPTKKQASVFDTELTRSMLFAMVRDDDTAPGVVDDEMWVTGDFSALDHFKFNAMVWRTFAADRRSHEVYALMSAADYCYDHLSKKASDNLICTFGPWIGSDSARTSVHHAATEHLKNAFPGKGHQHPADEFGGPWHHGARASDGWLQLRGPSNEAWFDPWVEHLQSRGVKFHFGHKLVSLDAVPAHSSGPGRVRSVVVRPSERGEDASADEVVTADAFVLAITPFSANDVVAASSQVVRDDPQCAKLAKLIQEGPHRQISFRIAFSEKVQIHHKRKCIILRDSEWNITLFPQDLFWHSSTDLGEGVKSLWTGTVCAAYVQGKLTGFDAAHCTRAMFETEVRNQIMRSKCLSNIVAKSNNGKRLEDFAILRFEVWHEWEWPAKADGVSIVTTPQLKWVTGIKTQPHEPSCETSIPNLFLAGSHCKTWAGFWCMEGAAESGRRAAFLIERSGRTPIAQYRPLFVKALNAADNLFYAVGLPNVVDVFFFIFYFIPIFSLVVVV